MTKTHSFRLSDRALEAIREKARVSGVTQGQYLEELVLGAPDPVAADYVTRQSVDALAARLATVEARLRMLEPLGATHVTTGGAVRVTLAEDWLAPEGEE